MNAIICMCKATDESASFHGELMDIVMNEGLMKDSNNPWDQIILVGSHADRLQDDREKQPWLAGIYKNFFRNANGHGRHCFIGGKRDFDTYITDVDTAPLEEILRSMSAEEMQFEPFKDDVLEKFLTRALDVSKDVVAKLIGEIRALRESNKQWRANFEVASLDGKNQYDKKTKEFAQCYGTLMNKKNKTDKEDAEMKHAGKMVNYYKGLDNRRVLRKDLLNFLMAKEIRKPGRAFKFKEIKANFKWVLLQNANIEKDYDLTQLGQSGKRRGKREHDQM